MRLFQGKFRQVTWPYDSMKWWQRHEDGVNVDRDMAYSSKRERNVFEMQTRVKFFNLGWFSVSFVS